MTQENTNVNEEIQNQEVVQPEEAHEEPSQDLNDTPSQQDDKEYNFAQLRKGKEQLEKKLKEKDKTLQELQEYVQSLKKPSDSPSPSQENWDIDDEDVAEGRHVKKLNKEIANLKLQLVQDSLYRKYPDFDQVVTKENIEKLKTTEPELYSSIISSQDYFAKGVSAYKTLKALGIVHPDYTEQKNQVQSNHKRPLSAQAIKGSSALSDSNIFARGLTSELKEQLRKEMAEAAKAR